MHRFMTSAAAALALVLAGVAGAPATAAPSAPAPVPQTVQAAQKYFWIWSDGSEKSKRTFKESKYGDQASLPHLVVTVEPAKPARTVYLQFKQDGKWIVENKVTSDGQGKAIIDINPYCSKNNWCDGTYAYRLKIGDRFANLKITYAEK